MAGHSKWANIRHKKGRADAKRGKVFSQIAKEIISAVKISGPDQKSNPRLRLAIQKARSVNMPMDTVERNIKKASSADQGDFFEMTYELYGHGGVGILVEVMTDNKNRIASDMRIATNKKGGSIASPGSVAFNFDRKGILFVEKDQTEEEQLFLLVTEAGAEDFTSLEEGFVVETPPEALYQVKEVLEQEGISTEKCELEFLPKVEVACNKEDKESNEALIAFLDDLEDVSAVFHNMEEQ